MHNPTQLTNVREGSARADHPLVRWTLIALALGVVGMLVIIPVVNVFTQAFSGGWKLYWHSLFVDRDTRHAILLTLIVAPISVAVNTVFGVAAAWAIARFRFPGRTLLTTLIDLPFSVSPVVAGLSIVLIFGLQGYLGPWLREHDFKVIFALPGLILATTFVTLPFVARELIPVMEAIGADEEVAAVSLGASAWQTFWYVTLPNIKWGLLYGVVLCNARAMGEFGAVYVVSGHIAGRTETMPLRVEKLFQEYNTPGSFSLASLLTLLALVTLIAKVAIERKTRAQLREATAPPAGGEEEVSSVTVGTAVGEPAAVAIAAPRHQPRSFVEISHRRGIASRPVAARRAAGNQG
ncbi:MAG TPA: sulfate ABC transporter permease subunit CysW [Pirellulales bacterium]|nr:sulfate ABC transporter permease subunit CysW [Pirellulales bacterium]